MFGAASLNGRGLIAISPVIWNDAQWLCDDKRRTALTTNGKNGNGNQSYFSTKYRDYANYGDYAPQIRYAEVLLTLAEASFAAQEDLIKAVLMERRIEFLCEGKRWADISRLATDATYGTGGIPAKAVNGADGLAIYNCKGRLI